VCNLSLYFAPFISDDRCHETIAPNDSLQLFLNQRDIKSLVYEAGGWKQFITPEQTALALSQVAAAHILPPLLPLECGTDLLEYHVRLRNHMHESLVSELMLVLKSSWRTLGWEQVGSTTYLCVIGAGVAACIEATPKEEQLYLRYASDLEHALFLAGRTLDLPRSRLFLQTTLYERFDVLLTQVRSSTWNWLND
jgi:hypothetical protein